MSFIFLLLYPAILIKQLKQLSLIMIQYSVVCFSLGKISPKHLYFYHFLNSRKSVSVVRT